MEDAAGGGTGLVLKARTKDKGLGTGIDGKA
jgi:hypothetical protein